MSPESVAHRICEIAARPCRSASRLEPAYSRYCHWLCGQRVTILTRPLREAEWDMVRAFARRLERRDVSLRFGRALDLEDDATLRRYFDVEAGAGEIAWVLEETGAIAGIAHRIKVSQLQAEAALIVRSDLRRLGIGEFLLRQMLARSASEGLETLSASVLRENWAVLRLAAKVGGTVQPTSARTVDVTFSKAALSAAERTLDHSVSLF